MKLVIHSVGTWSHPNIRLWEPDNADDFAITLTVNIGPKGQKGGDDFYIKYATPIGLNHLENPSNILSDRSLIVTKKFDYQELWKWLSETIKSCEKQTWAECVEKLLRYFDWEFENYTQS